MSLRSGVFIKYVIEFAALKVSNDLLAGDMCLDADITVTMARGIAGTTFTIALTDLPEKSAKALEAAVLPAITATDDPPRVKVRLGYFDTRVDLVVDGVYESVESTVNGDKLITTIKGREAAVYACRIAKSTAALTGTLSFADTAKGLLATNPYLPPNCVDTTPRTDLPASPPLENPKFNARTVLQALDELARRASAELLVADGKVFLGKPVVYDDATPAPLDTVTTLAKFEPLLKLSVPAPSSSDKAAPGPAQSFKGFGFTALGDPVMRPGQAVVLKNIKNYPSGSSFRIRDVKHVFSSTSGYTCVGNATEPLPDGAIARQIDALIGSGPDSTAAQITDRIRAQASENPSIEVAAVKAAAELYRADLYYGQTAEGNETQASVNVAIDQQDDHVYKAKPIASPFAWRKCGLVTPVYPGMKAILLHNRGSASDAVVAGYTWSKQPDYPPPSNQVGDWWLCLPVDVDATAQPSDATKAVNDLTGGNGKRVIEVKGLRITVGSGKLGQVGTRPSEGEDDEFLIEHASGTSIRIDAQGAVTIDAKGASTIDSAGALTIKASGPMTIDASSASLTIKGNVLVQGNVEIE